MHLMPWLALKQNSYIVQKGKGLSSEKHEYLEVRGDHQITVDNPLDDKFHIEIHWRLTTSNCDIFGQTLTIILMKKR